VGARSLRGALLGNHRYVIDRGTYYGLEAPSGQPAEIFVSCSEASQDKALRAELETHLKPLATEGLVRVWHRDKTGAGEARTRTAAERLDSAHIVLLLVSATYLASDDCSLEAERAMARSGAIIVPVPISPAAWEHAPFSDLAPLPSARPVTSWPMRDEAWSELVRKLRDLIERHDHKSSWPPATSSGPVSGRGARPTYPDRMTRVLSEELEEAYERRTRLEAIGQDTDALTNDIINLKRQLRAAGHLKAGDVLGSDGRYLLMSKLGKGGFALIWRARDRKTGEDVAIKVLRPDLAADPGRLDRFRRGARVMKRLRHPSIVRVLDIPPPDLGWYFYVMELLRGGDLGAAMLSGKINQEQVFSIILSVSSSVAAVHAANWVHRDVKPANIMLTEANEPKLTDFDLVGGPETTGGTDHALGTPLYQAPELITRPHELDPRADVYSLGMTALYALLKSEGWLDDILFRDHPRTLIGWLGCSGAVKDVLLRAVDVDVDRRFINAGAFHDALARAVGRPSQPPDSPPESFRDVTGQIPRIMPRSDPPPKAIDVTKVPTERIFPPSQPVRDTPLLAITDAYLVLKACPPGAPVDSKLMLIRSPTSVVRDASIDHGGIVLPHGNISRAHARIELRGFSLVVIDEGSLNGTYVSEGGNPRERDRVSGVALLRYGNLINFGREYLFQLEFMPYVGSEQYMREYERLKVDARTGLPSRRYLLSCLEREALEAQQRNQTLSFLVLQLLKRSGDPGPPVDGLLTDLARIVERQDIDGLVGRFGGRSIGVILKGMTSETASQIAAEVRWQAPPSMTIRAGAAEILYGDQDPAEALRNRVLAALEVPLGEDGKDL
jgi:serine/threonine protein kinase/GGDEF domain-containing protein